MLCMFEFAVVYSIYKLTKMCGPQIRELGGEKTWDTQPQRKKKKNWFHKTLRFPPRI